MQAREGRALKAVSEMLHYRVLPALRKGCVCRQMMINCAKRLSALTPMKERSECCCLAYVDVLALIPEWSYGSQL